jgi:hypothetical protein
MGKIVPIKNSQALAKGIIEVLQSSAVVDEASVNSLKGNYSPESVARAYEALYENLLERDE